MAHKKEFLPPARQGQLDMAQQWLRVLPEQVKDEKGVDTQKWKLWGIPEPVFLAFGEAFAKAQAALAEAKNKERNSDVVDQAVKSTFKALVTAMRSLKRRFFHMPPLTLEDWVALGFREPEQYTLSGDPTAQVMAETFLKGRHELGMRLVYTSGDPNDRANKSYRIFYKILEHGEAEASALVKAAPTRPEDFALSFPERRKLFTHDFGFDSSGKTVYFCAQVENGKRVGPFGAITSAIIP